MNEKNIHLIEILKHIIIDGKKDLNIVIEEETLLLAKNHNLLNILKSYISNDFCPDVILEPYIKSVFTSLVIDARQQKELQLIKDKFNEFKITYMPIKGAVIKKMYPSSDMRMSSDIDILVKENDYPRIELIMEGLGFNLKNKSHAVHSVFIKNGVVIEIHKKLFSNNMIKSNFYNDIWGNAVNINKFEYQMSIDDTYIYLLMHIAKHMKKGGIGIKHFLDIFLYIRKYEKEMNWHYIKVILKKEELNIFENNVKSLLQFWFCGKSPNKTIKVLSDFVISGGSYGTLRNSYVSKLSVSQSSKIKFILNRLFPPREYMKRIYPEIEGKKCIFYYWIKRILKSIMSMNKILDETKTISVIEKSDVEFFLNFKRTIGL